MFKPTNRRRFLQTTATSTALAGLGNWAFLSRLPRVSAEEAQLNPGAVGFQSDIEPLVRLLEETSRERLLEEVAARIQSGTSYREILAALLLAGVRNVQPRPSVGFKFHAVLVVNSAHLASLGSPDEHRWLPIFWALDYFKDAQAQDVRENNWTMAAVDESAVPPADRARQEFIEAMDNWDEARADAAVAGLARSATPAELFELFCRYGSRDFRSIGHKAIFVANSWRTLDSIGWQYAEPVLRSLAYALLMHEEKNPSQSDLPADRPGRENVARAGRIRADWQEGRTDDRATTELLTTLRQRSAEEACDHVVELLNSGIAPQSIWDGLLVGAGELLMRQPAIVALHAVTTSNALTYAYQASTSDENRRMLLLQNAAFLPLFREAMKGRGSVADVDITQIEPVATESGQPAVDEILAEISRDRMSAARKVLAYGQGRGDVRQFIDGARLQVFFKGTNSHDYKFSSAVLEDYAHVSPSWRDRYLAASVFNLRGSGDSDNRLVERTRAALAS
jgi:hypothetical protein